MTFPLSNTWREIIFHNNMIPRRFLLFVAAAFVLQFQMYAQLRMILIILSLAQFQLEGRAFLRLFEIQRRRRNRHGHPYFWVLPRPADSWFDIHHNDPRIQDEYFRKQLRMRRATFRLLLDVLRPYITRQNTRFRRCIEPEKVLAIGLTGLAHGGTYVSIGPGFNVGTTTVIEAVEDMIISNSQKLKLNLLKRGKLSKSFLIFQMWLVQLIAHMSRSKPLMTAESTTSVDSSATI